MAETWVVTGGAGFIGANFVRRTLAHSPRSVVILDKLTYAGNLASLGDLPQGGRLTFIQADIADRAAVREVLAAHRPTAVVNFAAETHVDRSIDGPDAFVHTNLVGTFQLLEAARRYWSALPDRQKREFRFLHVSTDEVYGTLGPEGLFSEETPYAPNSPYSATKAGADHLVRAYLHTYGLPTLITNCSNNYGPYQFPEKLIPLMILNALDARPLPIYGDGLNVRDWLFVEDHCEAITQVLERGGVGEKYNIGGENERTNLEIVDTICQLLDRMTPLPLRAPLSGRGLSSYAALKIHVPDRPGHDRRYAIDASRVRRDIGWRPAHDLASGLECTVGWYLANLDWCRDVQEGYHRERLGLSAPSAGV